MKKITAILLSLILVFSFAACGNNQQAKDTAPEPSSESVGDTISESEKTEQPSEMPSDSQTESEDNTGDTDMESTGGKTLIVYYSASGNTEEVANYIASATDGDLFEIVPAEIYTNADLDWTDGDSRVSREHDNEDERNVPLVADTVDNWDEYDTVFIGYPIWWGIAAWPVDGFIKANDFTGKTVIPFCTSSSSGLGESGELLEEMAGTGGWLEGERFRSGASEETVRSWVEGLGL
ncbi:MAG: flavodoxin [Eubacterium sp.]|nr:flavodoxin [Eubacterium sp.]